MRVRRTGGGRPQGAPTSRARQYASSAALSASLVALPLLLAGGSASETSGSATAARISQRPPLSRTIDQRRLAGLELPVGIRDGMRVIANVDGSLPEPQRLATLFAPRVASGPQGVPVTALRAYRNAAEALGAKQPGCHLDWALIAGIGRLESNHARGGYVDEHGNTIEPILGPVLDGSGNTAAIPDTDNGKFDGNTEWDRAVGPLQFIPSTWRRHGADGNGDGVANPHNVYDASLAAGRYLCSGGADLSNEDQLRTAVYRYNHSASYVAEVLAWADAYRDGVTELPDSDVPLAAPTRVAAEPAPEPVREPDESASDTDPAPGERARDSRSDSAPDSGGPTRTTPSSTSMTPSSTPTSESSTTTTTTTTTISPTTTTSDSEPTTTTPSTSTSTTSTTSERCGPEEEPTSTTTLSSTTPTSTAEPSADTRDGTCGTETPAPSTTSTR